VEDVASDGAVGPVSNDALRAATGLRVTAVASDGGTGNLGIREVSLPGVEASRPLLMPESPTDVGSGSAVVLTPVSAARTACVVADGQVRCDPTATRGDGDAGVIDRIVTTTSTTSGEIRIAGSVRTGAAAAALFDPVGAGIRARASSWLGRDVRVRPSAAVDGDPTTSWVADVGDLVPSLTLDWGQPRVVSSVRLVADAQGQQFSRTLAVTLKVGSRTVDSLVGAGGVVTFPATTASALTLTVVRTTPLVSIDGGTGIATQSPVAVAEIEVQGAADLVYRPDPDSRSGAVCGLGPTLAVDGVERPTLVTTSLGAVLRGEEAVVRPCRGNAVVTLAPGRHRMTVHGSALVDPVRVVVGDPVATAPARAVTVDRWEDTDRAVTVASGPESVLRVAESSNVGWVATLDGQTLTPVRVDGWQQGWIVPAGEGGTVSLVFAPASVQYAGMAAGAGIALLGLLVGLFVPRRGAGWELATPRRLRPATTWVVQLATGVVLLGPVGAVAGLAAAIGAGRRWSPALAGAFVLGAAVAAGLTAPAWATSGLALAGALLALGTALRRRGR
jgi:arabinofuranan 3-O-arabinosyltransferase